MHRLDRGRIGKFQFDKMTALTDGRVGRRGRNRKKKGKRRQRIPEGMGV